MSSCYPQNLLMGIYFYYFPQFSVEENEAGKVNINCSKSPAVSGRTRIQIQVFWLQILITLSSLIVSLTVIFQEKFNQ